jgi:hypothetical protein
MLAGKKTFEAHLVTKGKSLIILAPGWTLSQLAIHFLLRLLGGAPGGGDGEGGGCRAVNVVILFSSLLTLRVNKLECFTIACLKCAGEDKSLPT